MGEPLVQRNVLVRPAPERLKELLAQTLQIDVQLLAGDASVRLAPPGRVLG